MDLGQFVGIGTPLAAIFATANWEIELSVTDSDMMFIPSPKNKTSNVELTLTLGSTQIKISALITRTSGSIHPQSRLTTLIAEFQPDDELKKSLLSGLFVSAKIEGKTMPDIYKIPRDTVHDQDKIYVVDEKNMLHMRSITPIYVNAKYAWIKGDIQSNERLCISTLQYVVEGMDISPIEASK